VLFTHRFVQHRARAIVALLVLALAALALAACGSSSGSGNAETLLRQTFGGSHRIKSGKANIQLRVDVTGDASLQGPIEATIAGPFQSAGSEQLPKFDLSLDANAQGQSIRAGLISTSDQLFVAFGGTDYAVPAQVMQRLQQTYRRAQQQHAAKHTSLATLGIDPLGWLKDPTVVGTESVGGVQTDHISAKVNVNALLDDVDKLLARVSSGAIPTLPSGRVPSRLPASARAQIEQAVKSATFDVWSGKSDHTLRRLAFALNVEPPNGKPRSVTVNLSVELTELNQPQTIAAPATSRPLSELLGQFQGLLGGALGGSGGSGGTGSSGGASSAQLNAYAKCVQRAGSNVTEAQKCASLLTR